MTLEQLSASLKEYEVYCYRIAYYFLEQESAAMAAAQGALLELGEDRRFFQQSSEERRTRAKQAAMKHALRSYADAIAE